LLWREWLLYWLVPRGERCLDLLEVASIAHKVIVIMSGIELLEHLSLVLDTPRVDVDADLLF
jgi:hypothetical protein